MMTATAANRLVDALWYGGSRWSVLLLPLAWVFGAAAALRRLAYRRGLLVSRDGGAPVIVVGNVSAGGTGKTPVVIWLAEALQQRGYRPAVVSRGYGAGAVREPRRAHPSSVAAEVGDEPLLIARRTGVPVFVATDRTAAVAAAVSAGADVVVADDGLQHYRMRRVAEIAVVDGRRGLGNGLLIPAGPLREPASRLREVDHVLVNGGGATPGRHFRLRPDAVVNLRTAERRSLESFAGCTVYAVAGIGNPQRFHDTLRNAGLRVIAVAVPDHGRTDLATLARRAEADTVFMTEKDAVKYLPDEHPAAWYLSVSLEMESADEDAVLNSLIEKVAGYTSGSRR